MHQLLFVEIVIVINRGSGQYFSQYWLVAHRVQLQYYLICSVYYLFNVYIGDESKVPNMQDVVRKLLNALHHAIMSHVVRYFLNGSHCL